MFRRRHPAPETSPMRRPTAPPHRLKFRNDALRLELPTGRNHLFPKEFRFGAASASHQVDGFDEHSDWWRYERRPGTVRAFGPAFAREHKSDHWARFDEDLGRMRDELGLGAYRFSVDWSRLEPREGEWRDDVLQTYADRCRRLNEAGVRPCVTLFHWSSPDWIWDHADEERTGWYDPRIVERFTRYVERLVPALAPHVDMFFTLNEPNIFLYGAFAEGILCPGHRRDDRDLVPVLRHLLQCHRNAYRLVKAARPDAQVGIAHQFCPMEPEKRWGPISWLAASKVERAFTWSFPDAIATGAFRLETRTREVIEEPIDGLAGTADFMGVNFYERMLVRLELRRPRPTATVLHDHLDSKEIWPTQLNTRGFVEMLAAVQRRYGLPLHVTENGQSHPDDRRRETFLREHLAALAWAMGARKLDVRGYFWWSLLDNQEWANGFVPRLGLYEVDYSNGERRLRQTGRTYTGIIRTREVRS